MDTFASAWGIAPAAPPSPRAQTVADAFRFGGWGRRSVPTTPTYTMMKAWSPWPNNNVYVEPGYLTWGLLIHEVIHKTAMLYDATIASNWAAYRPSNAGSGTDWFNTVIENACK